MTSPITFHSEPEFKQRRVVVARFVGKMRKGSWHMTPEAARALADELQSAADRVLNAVQKLDDQ